MTNDVRQVVGLSALAEHWREQADSGVGDGYAAILRDCARELDAELALEPTRSQVLTASADAWAEACREAEEERDSAIERAEKAEAEVAYLRGAELAWAEKLKQAQADVERLKEERDVAMMELYLLTHREYDDNAGRCFDNRRKLARQIGKFFNCSDAQIAELEKFSVDTPAPEGGYTIRRIMEMRIEEAKLTAPPAPSGWQPIETAPKDGTEILAWFLGERVIAKWSEGYREWVGLNVKWYDGQQTVTGLRNGWGEGGPSHWMPLPPAPTQEPTA